MELNVKKLFCYLVSLFLCSCGGATYRSFDIDVAKAPKVPDKVAYTDWNLATSMDPIERMADPDNYSLALQSSDYDVLVMTKDSDILFVSPYLRTISKSPVKCYYGTSVWYKGKKLGDITAKSRVCPTDDSLEYLQKILPIYSLCAARIGYNGVIGGESFVEGETSPSVNDFLSKCKMVD